ncbi:MAG: CHASE2 domain-containing protein [Chitinophagaceae bacterium]
MRDRDCTTINEVSIFMEWLIAGSIIIIMLLVAAPLSGWIRLKAFHAVVIAASISLLLLPVTLLLLNQNYLVLPQQNQAVTWAARLNRKAAREKASEWVKNNFIFIDISWSHQLIPAAVSNQFDTSTEVITNRYELTRLLEQLKTEDTLTDGIVCDVFFDQSSPADPQLRDALAEPAIATKIILAHNPAAPNLPVFASLEDSVYADISEKGEEQFFASYQPLHAAVPTFAYRIYQRMQSIQTVPAWNNLLVRETSADGRTHTGINSFIPSFILTDEKELYGNPAMGVDSETNLTSVNYLTMGDASVFAQGGILHQLLGERRQEGRKNIIFIGSFRGPERDIHQTFYGRLHGPTIWLNLTYSLLNRQHLLSFGFLLYLWIGMGLVFYCLIRSALYLPLVPVGPRKKTTGHEQSGNKRLSFLRSVVDIIFMHEIHLWVFILFIVLTALAWGKIINGFLLLLLTEFIYRILRHHADEHR